MATPLKSVSFWIKAFIPANVPGLSKKIPKGSYAGRWALPGPVDDWYLTDERTWSSNVNAKARITFVVCIEFNGNGEPLASPRVHHSSYCDVTTAVDPDSGKAETKTGVVTLIIPPCVGGKVGTWMNQTFVNYNLAACNPFFSLGIANVSPDIDMKGIFHVSPQRREVWVDGMVDEFPAYEMYAAPDVNLVQTCSAVIPKLVARRFPDNGKSPNNLWGGANRSFKSSKVVL